MALKNLSIKSINYPRIPSNIAEHTTISQDADIACKIIDSMFDQINRCLQQDRSRVKVNMLTKGIVGKLLGNGTRNRIKEYLINMYDNDIRELLDDIQKEMNKRKK